MITIDFIYNIKDKVRINSIKTEGIIIGYYFGETGRQYQVAYFLNGERKTFYLYEEEISKLTGNEVAGYVK